jgi:hypothetical protein
MSLITVRSKAREQVIDVTEDRTAADIGRGVRTRPS